MYQMYPSAWTGDLSSRGIFVFSLIPYREKSSESGMVKRGPYSPFQVGTSNKVDYVLARVDDLVNWGRKVIYICYRK